MKRIFTLFLSLLVLMPALQATLSTTRIVPTDGSANVDINARVIVMFDKNIEVLNGGCTLNGEALTPSIANKMATFILPCLDYSTTYTFVAPAAAFSEKGNTANASPEVRFSFTTKARTQPEARLFDAIVAPDGSGDYTSVQEAINKAPENQTKPWLIFVRKGVYNGVLRIPSSKPYIHLIGEDVDSTVIQEKICCDFLVDGGYTGSRDPEFVAQWKAYVDQFATGRVKNSQGQDPMAYIDAKNFYSENITYNNRWGSEDRDYPQALAIRCLKDRTAFYHCRALSYQDTWRTPDGDGSRQYIKDCYIEGNVDFIYGDGDAFFENCQINIIKNHKPTEEAGWIVAPSHSGTTWGYVFKDCRLTSEVAGDSIYLGRAWIASPKTVFINLELDDKIYLRPEGWDSHFGNAIPIIFADWHTHYANGEMVDLSQRNNWYWYLRDVGDTIQGYAKQYISDEEAAQYTFNRVIPASDGWRPDLMAERLPAPVLNLVGGTTVKWEAVPFAICYEVRKNGDFVCFTTETSYTADDANARYQVLAVNEWGGRGNLSDYATALHQTTMGNAVLLATEYYDLTGRRISLDDNTGRRQLVLCKTVWSDGKVQVEKQIR